MAKRKRLTAEAFDAAAANTNMSDKTLEIARRVLVGGEMQKDVASTSGLTPQTVNDHVQRVWREHTASADLPPGTQRITVVLSKERAQVVLGWAREEQIARIELPKR